MTNWVQCDILYFLIIKEKLIKEDLIYKLKFREKIVYDRPSYGIRTLIDPLNFLLEKPKEEFIEIILALKLDKYSILLIPAMKLGILENENTIKKIKKYAEKEAKLKVNHFKRSYREMEILGSIKIEIY